MSMRKTIIAAAFAAVAVVGTAGTASADAGAGAVGSAFDSPGILSGNLIQIPLGLNAGVCGNNVSLLSSLTSALGNTCSNA